jgi:hypothetical protein
MSDHRIRIPDPALIRRAGNRMIAALVAILALATPLTIWGIVLTVAGEWAGVPLAVGGLVLAIAAITLTLSTLQIRGSLVRDSVSRESLLRARRTTRNVRRACLATLLGLLADGLIRGLVGEWWSMLTALVMGLVLFILATGTTNMAKAQDGSLSTIGQDFNNGRP